MEVSFTDELTSKVDAKGRVSIPAPHRAVLAHGDPACEDGKNPRLVMIHSKSHEPCLRIFTLEAYEKLRQEILDMPYGPARNKKARKLISKATPLVVDDNGRVILRKDLRERFAIGDAAIFVGSVDHLQIWDPEAYEDFYDDDDGEDPFVGLGESRQVAQG